MNMLFLTLVHINTLDEHDIYSDLLRVFIENGHNVDLVCPIEEKAGTYDLKIYSNRCRILHVNTGKVQKTSVIKKGITTLMLGRYYIAGIKEKLSSTKYDLVMYSTPPITLAGVVRYIKNRDNAEAYLLLKDIFPQNAVDLGMMTKTGLKAAIYGYFRSKEKQLYALSDHIGCMSPANAQYVISHNPEIPQDIVHVLPNSLKGEIYPLSIAEKQQLRKKFDIPLDKRVFIYGGNLGKPQSIPFIIECLKKVAEQQEAFFVICGDGTEFHVIYDYAKQSGQKNLRVISSIPRAEYEKFVGCCDVGLIFLDYRFTIPNFPSRMLSYMQKCMPVLACTDDATDLNAAIIEGKFGFWCRSNDSAAFADLISTLCEQDISELQDNSGKYFMEHYTAEQGYEIIMKNIGLSEAHQNEST